MNFYCIADEDTVRGFQLAGIAGQGVNSPQEASQALDQALQDANVGILILTQKVANDLRQQLDAIRLERRLPLIVEIPGPEGGRSEGKSLRKLVEEAVGINLGQGEEN